MQKKISVLSLLIFLGFSVSCVTSGPSEERLVKKGDSKSVQLGRSTSARLSRGANQKNKIRTIILPNGDYFTFEDVNGLAVQDDMIWGEVTDFVNPDGTTNRAAITSIERRKWNTLKIPYYIDPN